MKVTSLLTFLKEEGDSFDLRGKRGRIFPIFEILAPITVCLMMGIYRLRVMYRFFHPEMLLLCDKSGTQASTSRLSGESAEAWLLDRESKRKEAEAKAAQVMALLRQYSPFEHGVPHYSTFSRALKKIDLPKFLSGLYLHFMTHLPEDGVRHLLLDGKCLRGARNKSVYGNARYVINAMDAGSGLVTTSFPVGEKKNEASQLVIHLPGLVMGGLWLVTGDAMVTQKIIIAELARLGVDYILPVKGNQKNLQKLLLALMIRLCSSGKKASSSDFGYFLDLNGKEGREPIGWQQ